MLVPIWLGAPRPAWRPAFLGLPWDVLLLGMSSEFLGRYLGSVTPLTRDTRTGYGGAGPARPGPGVGGDTMWVTKTNPLKGAIFVSHSRTIERGCRV